MDATPPPAAPPSFCWSVRVYYEDTDAGGIVYYANYLKFFERCRTEWLRAAGGRQGDWLARDAVQFVVVRATVEYRRPARLDDLLRIDLQPIRVGRASLDLAQAAFRDSDLLATLNVRVACVDARTLAPRPFPPTVRTALQAPDRAAAAPAAPPAEQAARRAAGRTAAPPAALAAARTA